MITCDNTSGVISSFAPAMETRQEAVCKCVVLSKHALCRSSFSGNAAVAITTIIDYLNLSDT